MAFYRGPKIVRDNVTLMLDAADRNSHPGSGTSWYDLSGNGYNAAATNSPGFLSTNQGIVYFDQASNQRYQTTLNTATRPFGNSTTWECWVNCTQSINGYNMFMGAFLPYFGFYNGNQIIFSNDIAGSQRSIFSPTVTLNTWYHLAFTTQYFSVGNTTNMWLYINGVLSQTDNFAGAQSSTTTTSFTVGDGQGTPWYPFKGYVSNVRIYNRTLNGTEIVQNFNALRGRFGV